MLYPVLVFRSVEENLLKSLERLPVMFCVARLISRYFWSNITPQSCNLCNLNISEITIDMKKNCKRCSAVVFEVLYLHETIIRITHFSFHKHFKKILSDKIGSRFFLFFCELQ